MGPSFLLYRLFHFLDSLTGKFPQLIYTLSSLQAMTHRKRDDMTELLSSSSCDPKLMTFGSQEFWMGTHAPFPLKERAGVRDHGNPKMRGKFLERRRGEEEIEKSKLTRELSKPSATRALKADEPEQ